MNEVKYIVTVRGDAAHGLEINLEKATKVTLGVHAPYPWGTGKDVLSVERAPRGERDAELLWDGRGREMCPCCEGRGTRLSRLAEAIAGTAEVDALTAQRLAIDVLAALPAQRADA